MATTLCHIKVRAGRESEFEALARDLHRESHARETGCRRYEYWRGAEAGRYYALLAFDDFHAFLVHQTSDHHESASPALTELIEEFRMEWVDPLDGASDLPPTEMQPVPESADEKTRRYHKMFAATVQRWWRELRGS